jgi:hypothetical protein
MRRLFSCIDIVPRQCSGLVGTACGVRTYAVQKLPGRSPSSSPKPVGSHLIAVAGPPLRRLFLCLSKLRTPIPRPPSGAIVGLRSNPQTCRPLCPVDQRCASHSRGPKMMFSPAGSTSRPLNKSLGQTHNLGQLSLVLTVRPVGCLPLAVEEAGEREVLRISRIWSGS